MRTTTAVFGLAIAALAASSASAQSRPASASKPKETKFCIQYEKLTGSRIAETECKTKAQWKKEGVDVDDLRSKN